MADIDSVQLKAGDIVTVPFAIKGANQTLIDLAVHEIKKNLAADQRFNYQGSEIVAGKDADGNDSQVLNIYVQVRKKPRQEQTEVQPQEASALAPVVIALGTIVSLVWGATYLIAKRMELQALPVLVNGSAPESVKIAAVQAAFDANKKSVGSGVATAGNTLALGALALGGLWLLTQRKAGGSH